MSEIFLLDLGSLCVNNNRNLKNIGMIESSSIDSIQNLVKTLFDKVLSDIDNNQSHNGLVSLPKTTIILPRSKPIPKPRQPTKWELFAKSKGIVRQKRGGKVFDESTKMWVPRHGSKSIKNRKMNNWCHEEK